MATTALVLVVPVVIGVAVGGLVAGTVATVAAFFVYDFVFVPPYYTIPVGGGPQNWTALPVFIVVTVVTAQVVARLQVAHAEARLRTAEVRRLFDISELFAHKSSRSELLVTTVNFIRQAFDLDGVALLLPVAERLELAASTGAPFSEPELRRISESQGLPVTLATGGATEHGVQAIALVASGRAIGLLALRGLRDVSADRELLRAFIDLLALALERTQLREQAVRAQLLEEVDRLRRSLVGAVSHDLRTPLATIKVSASALLDEDLAAGEYAHRLIDAQADRLDRLVANVLDLTRIQSGALELRRRPAVVTDLVDEALSVLGPSADLERVQRTTQPDLPLVDVDRVLICQVLANLIDNATRYAPGDTAVTVSAKRRPDGVVEMAVADDGPGVPSDERMSIFQMFNRREAGGRGGLGLAIAHAFVEAHGQRIWVDDSCEPGARFVFTLPSVQSARAN